MGWGEMNNFTRSKEAREKENEELRAEVARMEKIAAIHVAKIKTLPERQVMPFVDDAVKAAREAGKNVSFDGYDGEIIHIDGKIGTIGVDDRIDWN